MYSTYLNLSCLSTVLGYKLKYFKNINYAENIKSSERSHVNDIISSTIRYIRQTYINVFLIYDQIKDQPKLGLISKILNR